MLKIENVVRLDLGVKAENLSRAIEIDCGLWKEQYPNGNINIYHQRPGETSMDVTGATYDNETGVLRWELTQTDTFIAGFGLAEIRLVEDNIVKKTATIVTLIHPSVVDESGGVIESNQQAYLDAASAIFGSTQREAIDAHAYAQDSEAWAKGTRDGSAVPFTDETFENNAKYYAEQAHLRAETARTYATTAVNYGTTAAQSASQATASATAAEGSKTAAANYSISAAGNASQAYQAKLDAQSAASNASSMASSATSQASRAISAAGRASNSENHASSSAEEAAASAAAAASCVTAAEAARDAAQAAAGDFQGLSATASGLPAGSQPNIEVTHSEGGLYQFAFGIPKGDKGDKGDTGDPAPTAQVTAAVEDWLEENMSNPDSPPLDRSLNLSSAAAPADLVGSLKSAINVLDSEIYESEDLLDLVSYAYNNNTAVTDNGDGSFTFGTTDYGITLWKTSKPMPSGTYTLQGIPQGATYTEIYVGPDNNYNNKIASNSSEEPIIFTNPTEQVLYYGVRSVSKPLVGYVFSPVLILKISNIENNKNSIEEQQEEIDRKLDKSELDAEGIGVIVPDVEYGRWANVNVGDTITPAVNNNSRRVILDLSVYIGWEIELSLVTSINPHITSGNNMYLANSNAVASVAFQETVFAYGATYKYTVTESTAYAYLSYATARSSSNFTAKAVSPLAIQFDKINTLEAEMETAVKPLSFPNLCENANIDDLTGFTANVATITAENHILTITPTARNSETHYTVPTALKEGHKYYTAIWVKSDYTGSGLFVNNEVLKSGSATQTIGSTKYNGAAPNTWQRLSFVTTAAPAYTTLRLEIYCNSTGLELMYAKEIVILDLTEIFGTGNEPDVGTVDTILAAYTNGTAFFEGTLATDVITNSIYPDPGAEKPIFVGISGYVMNVNAKYSATQDIRYKVGKAGSNELFNWRGFDFIDNSTDIVSPKVDLTQNITVITDWFGPHKLKAANNIDGDMPDSDNFTGGNHAYNGDSSGSPTARTASYAFYVDGRKVTSFLGYAYYVDVYWENRVQATNTKKADGTGREVLKETFHMHFDGDKWTLDGMLEPLEALSSWSYYGIQMSRASAYNGYIFYHDSQDNRTWHSTRAASNSGTDKCRTITMHDGADYFEMHIGTDGLGDFALNRQENSFFSTDSKTYSHLVKNASDIGANSVFTYCGWYKWYNQDFS